MPIGRWIQWQCRNFWLEFGEQLQVVRKSRIYFMFLKQLGERSFITRLWRTWQVLGPICVQSRKSRHASEKYGQPLLAYREPETTYVIRNIFKWVVHLCKNHSLQIRNHYPRRGQSLNLTYMSSIIINVRTASSQTLRDAERSQSFSSISLSCLTSK